MENKFVRDRISTLRMQKGVSEYKMSLDLGHSKSYIQSISAGNALPSMSEFLYICDYLNVTPQQFFDEGLQQPRLVEELSQEIRCLPEEDLQLLIQFAKRLNHR